MKVKKITLLVSALTANILAITAHAADEIAINPIISTGTSESYEEAEANLWFLLDDSGSMGYQFPWTYRTRGYGNHTIYTIAYGGYIDYVSTLNYEIPKQLDGTDMPLPDKIDSFYVSPFAEIADGISPNNLTQQPMVAKVGYSTFYGTLRHSSTSAAGDAIPRCSVLTAGKTDKQKKNCQIWLNYYRSKMHVLKSSLALTLFGEKNNKITSKLRVGYASLNKNGTAKIGKSNKYNEQTKPVMPLYGDIADTNKNSFNRWLYDLRAYNSTPLRKRAGEIYTEIVKTSQLTAGSPKVSDNPFLVSPGEEYNETTNPVLSCRRNYAVLLTDGVWNQSKNRNIDKLLNKSFKAGLSTEKTVKLPDGEKYKPMSPYQKIVTDNNNDMYKQELISTYPYTNIIYDPNVVQTYREDAVYYCHSSMGNDCTFIENTNRWVSSYNIPVRRKIVRKGTTSKTIADIAFMGWATDIDGNKNNNDMERKETPLLIKSGNEVIQEVQTLHGSSYWHPYNDPASWQHINTFTIGFGLADDNATINPPVDRMKTSDGIESKYLKNNFKWPVTVSTRYDRPLKSQNNRVINEKSSIDDLANAAVNGRGRFYNIQDPSKLKSAFDDILKEANEGGEKPGIKGSGGITGSSQFGLDGHYTTSYDSISFTGELTKYNLFDGNETNKASCFKSPSADNTFGQLCDKAAWNAGKKLTERTKERIIISSKQQNNNVDLSASDNIYSVLIDNLKYKQIPFELSKENDEISAYQKQILANNYAGYLKSYGLEKGLEEAHKALIDYTRGGDKFDLEKSGYFRQRVVEDPDTKVKSRNILGAMMRSAPKFAGVPFIGNNHPKLLDEDFVAFVKNYLYKKDGTALGTNPVDKNYVNMIYVGSNDGMLHAFKATDGEEVFAYVPNAVYKNLPRLVEKDKKTSFIDGGIDVQTFKIGLDWKQILVGAMGGGANGLYSLDVTNPKGYIDNNTPIARWEYTEEESKLFQAKTTGKNIKDVKSNMGNIIAAPGSVELSDGTMATIVGNGYNSENNKAALIVINLETGKPIQELVLDNTYTDDAKPNGLAPVTFLSYAGKKGNTHRPDRAYAGDLQGNLWVFDLTKATKNGGITVVNNQPLFVAKYKDSNGKVTKQPITVAPLVKEHPTKYGFLVHFGTGSLFAEEDISSKINNSIYAIWDDWIPSINSGLPKPRNIIVKRKHLREVKFKNLDGDSGTTKDGTTKQVRLLDDSEDSKKKIQWAISGTKFSTKRRGWVIDLLKGERAWQAAYTDYGTDSVTSVSYNTVKYNNKDGKDSVQLACGTISSGVTSWVLAFNEKDAAQPLKYSGVLDTNADGSNTEDDQIDLGDKKSTPTSGLQIQDIVFNPAESNLYASLAIFGSDDDPNGGDGNPNDPPTGGNDDLPSLTKTCTWKNSLSSSALSNNIVVKQNCLRSHTGSWVELRGE